MACGVYLRFLAGSLPLLMLHSPCMRDHMSTPRLISCIATSPTPVTSTHIIRHDNRYKQALFWPEKDESRAQVPRRREKKRKSKEHLESLLIVINTTEVWHFSFVETDVSALCIDVSGVKSLTGESRKSVSFSLFSFVDWSVHFNWFLQSLLVIFGS